MSKKLVQSKAILNSLLILKFPFWFNFTTIKRSIRVLTHKVHLSDRTNWYRDLCTRVQTFVHAHLLSTKTLSQDGEFLSFQFTITHILCHLLRTQVLPVFKYASLVNLCFVIFRVNIPPTNLHFPAFSV